jgi:predicted GNAT family acetyltransferase
VSSDYTIAREGDNAGAFVMRDERGPVGRLDFRVEDNVLAIDYVIVDGRLRGRGLGVHLVDAAIAWARETNRAVRPYCGYAARVLRSATYRDVMDRGPA